MLAVGVAALAIALAGCASVGGAGGPESAASHWTGRMSLRVDSAPPQSFSAFFDLRGNARSGQLQLTSPIGNTLGMARWAPGQATLQSGSNIHQFDSPEAMIEAATGAAIPLEALFGWLDGRQEAVAGWQADLSQISSGRLQAMRESPRPAADLRVVFERQ